MPMHVSADGNSRICFDPSSGGNGAPVLSFALNMKIPIAALVAALTEYQRQVVEDELMSRASQALAIPADHSPPDPGDRSLDARMPPPPVPQQLQQQPQQQQSSPQRHQNQEQNAGAAVEIELASLPNPYCNRYYRSSPAGSSSR